MATISERNAEAIGRAEWTECEFVLCNIAPDAAPIRSAGIAKGFFGIHKNPDANGPAYALTHLPTGGRIARGADEAILKSLADDISSLLDWDADDPAVISGRRTESLWFRLEYHDAQVRRRMAAETLTQEQPVEATAQPVEKVAKKARGKLNASAAHR